MKRKWISGRSARSVQRTIDHTRGRGDRGVALLIALVVTTLLIALVFEFAYATRVSLRAAANFRDSQRAYYLARSGVLIFSKYRELQDLVPQGEWGVVPVVSEGDTTLRIKWEDEGGKIRVLDVKNKTGVSYAMMDGLFESKGVSREVRDRMTDAESDIQNMRLLSGLHKYMSDEDYVKVDDFLTIYNPDNRININTASPEVLESLGIAAGTVSMIVAQRNKEPYKDLTTVAGISGMNVRGMPGSNPVANYLKVTSDVLKVTSSATVGGYTKVVEAVINRSSSAPIYLYWREM